MDTSLPSTGRQPSFSDRLRQSKALVPTFAVMAVAIAALAATLAATQLGAQAPDARAAAPQPQVTAAPAQPAPLKQAQPAVAAKPAPAPRTATSCTNCGVVESVVAVQRQAPVEGIAGTPVTVGTVAGGVVGGLLGNQIGGGNGRTAATVLGVAGGAYAGNAIEKNMKKYTAYQVRVRMNDGTVRTVEQRASVAAGSRVVVEGGAVRPLPSQG
jgi:outer membrane lipoprotein SlyB